MKLSDYIIFATIIICIIMLARYFIRSNGSEGGAQSDALALFNKNSLCTILLFSSPKCGHCVNFEPEWVKLTEKANSFKFACKKINVEEPSNAELKQMFNVTGWPTIIFLAPNGSYAVHTGPRKHDIILQEVTLFLSMPNLQPKHNMQNIGDRENVNSLINSGW